MNWLEVSLIVDGEMAEAAAEVFARFVENGVAIESTAVTAEADDSQGRAVGPLRVCAYLPVDERLEETRQRLEEALWYLGRIRPLPTAQFRMVKEEDWANAWKEHYRPIAIGRRLEITPAWLETQDAQRVTVRMDPGMAFGTGTHPTTQLCLELIEERYSQPGQGGPAEVIDLGCGSGILAIAALKLGARAALGVDIDPEAVTAALENAALNGAGQGLAVGAGSLDEIRAGNFAMRRAPLVVANILAVVIVRLLDEGLEDLLAPGGELLLSGILQEQAVDVEAALSRRGLRVSERRSQGDWIAIAATT
ncbi:MAG: 50S ribosomal protein L11 methyltransferase [Chloroflexi bacterium]|nr:50S ribosomal protein L11 methyltransferase [Chloroflexota bacterium]